MNKIKFIALSIFILSLFSCVEKMDYRNMDKDIKYGTSLVVPVGYSTLTASELFETLKDTNFVADETKNIIYYHFSDSYSFPVKEFLSVDLSIASKNSYPFKNQLGSVVLPTTVNNTNVSTINSQLTSIKNGEFDFAFDAYEGGNLVRRVDYVNIKSTTLKVSTATTGITGLSANGAKIRVTFKFPQIAALANRTFTMDIDANNKQQEWTLNDVEIDFLSNHRPKSKVNVDMDYTLICPSGSTINLASNADVETTVEFSNTVVSVAKGWLNHSTPIAQDYVFEQRIPQNILNSKLLDNDKLYFYNPILTFTVRNNIGVPMLLNVNNIECSNGAGQTIRANFNGNTSTTEKINRSANIGTEGITNIECNRTYGGTNQFFTIKKPSKFAYNFSVLIDHNVAQSDFTNNIQHFIVRPAYMKMDVDLKLPFHFDQGSEFVSLDTIANVKLDSLLQDVNIDIDKLQLNIDFKNHTPMYGIAKVRFLDNQNTEVYTLNSVEIKCPDVDTNGFAQKEAESSLVIALDRENINNVRKTDKIVIEYTVKGKTANNQINIRATDWIKVVVSLFGKASYNTNLDTLLNK